VVDRKRLTAQSTLIASLLNLGRRDEAQMIAKQLPLWLVSFRNKSNGPHKLVGTLSSSAGKLGRAQPSGYLDGNVTSYDANTNDIRPGGPGHVYGEGGPPTVSLEK
jgi:hypothetical protein